MRYCFKKSEKINKQKNCPCVFNNQCSMLYWNFMRGIFKNGLVLQREGKKSYLNVYGSIPIVFHLLYIRQKTILNKRANRKYGMPNELVYFVLLWIYVDKTMSNTFVLVYCFRRYREIIHVDENSKFLRVRASPALLSILSSHVENHFFNFTPTNSLFYLYFY